MLNPKNSSKQNRRSSRLSDQSKCFTSTNLKSSKLVEEVNFPLLKIFNEAKEKLEDNELSMNHKIWKLKYKCDAIYRNKTVRAHRQWARVRGVLKFLFVMKSLLNKKKMQGLSSQLKALENIKNDQKQDNEIFKWFAGEYKKNEIELKPKKRFLLYDDSKFLKYWSYIIVLLFFYTAIFLPFKMAFVVNEDLFFIILDYFVNSLFLVDIFVSIFTVYTKYGILIDSYSKIFLNYLATWFLIDLISIFPFELFLNDGGGFTDFAQLSRIFKLFKIFRIIKMTDRLSKNKNRHRFTGIIHMSRQVEEFIAFVLVIILLTHITGCIWYFISTLEDDINWLTMLQFPKETSLDLYLISFYWAFSTICTVGFGDITPVTVSEKIFNICWICMGVAFYSYTIGTLSNILNSSNSTKSVISSRFAFLNQFSKEKKINRKLLEQITHNLEYLEESDQYSDNADSTTFLKDISLDLTYKIAKYIHTDLVEKVILFYNKDINFIAQIIPFIFPRKFKSGEIIYKKNDYPSFIYFLLSGRVGFFNNSNKLFKTYVEGSYFGEIELFKSCLRQSQVKALTDIKMLLLPRENFLSKIESFPEILEEMMLVAIKRDIINKRNAFYLEKLSFMNFNSLITEKEQEDFIKQQNRCHQTILGLKKKINDLVDAKKEKDKMNESDTVSKDSSEENGNKIIEMRLSNVKRILPLKQIQSTDFSTKVKYLAENFKNLREELEDSNTQLNALLKELKQRNLQIRKNNFSNERDIQCDLDIQEINSILEDCKLKGNYVDMKNGIPIVSENSDSERTKTIDDNEFNNEIIYIESASNDGKAQSRSNKDNDIDGFSRRVKVNRFNFFNMKAFKKINKVHPKRSQKSKSQFESYESVRGIQLEESSDNKTSEFSDYSF